MNQGHTEESIVDVKAGNTEKTADINGNTDNTVDVNENTIEVTVHVPPEGENGLNFVQDYKFNCLDI